MKPTIVDASREASSFSIYHPSSALAVLPASLPPSFSSQSQAMLDILQSSLCFKTLPVPLLLYMLLSLPSTCSCSVSFYKSLLKGQLFQKLCHLPQQVTVPLPQQPEITVCIYSFIYVCALQTAHIYYVSGIKQGSGDTEKIQTPSCPYGVPI